MMVTVGSDLTPNAIEGLKTWYKGGLESANLVIDMMEGNSISQAEAISQQAQRQIEIDEIRSESSDPDVWVFESQLDVPVSPSALLWLCSLQVVTIRTTVSKAYYSSWDVVLNHFVLTLSQTEGTLMYSRIPLKPFLLLSHYDHHNRQDGRHPVHPHANFLVMLHRRVFAAPTLVPASSPQPFVPSVASDIISAIVSTEPPLLTRFSLPPLPPRTPTSEITGTVSIESSRPRVLSPALCARSPGKHAIPLRLRL
jgi:hypothetical protein